MMGVMGTVVLWYVVVTSAIAVAYALTVFGQFLAGRVRQRRRTKPVRSAYADASRPVGGAVHP